MKTLISLLLLIIISSCSPVITQPGGRITGILLLEDEVAMYEYLKRGKKGSKRKDFGIFYDTPNAYFINTIIDSITAEQIYPELNEQLAKD